MKVCCATTFDVRKPERWARRHLGLFNAGARIVRALEQENIEVEALEALSRRNSLTNKFKWLLYQRLFKQDFCSWADPSISKQYARQLRSQLAQTDADILLCLENAIPLATTNPDRPMVLWTDTTLGSLIDFYPHMSNLCQETKTNITRMEKRVLERCSLIVVNSSWAARRANELYDTSLEKIKVIPRVSKNANSYSKETIREAIAQRGDSVCHLLFMGVDWQRKGGNTALKVATLLNKAGIKTELHVVGCRPPSSFPDFVKPHGFVDRTTDKGRKKLDQLFRATHFLIYPTQADALGMVLSEAGAYGIPALATDVGGISDLVQTDITGKTFALGSDPANYCDFVIPYIENRDSYQELANSTLDYYYEYASEAAVGSKAMRAFSSLVQR